MTCSILVLKYKKHLFSTIVQSSEEASKIPPGRRWDIKVSLLIKQKDMVQVPKYKMECTNISEGNRIVTGDTSWCHIK